MDKTAANIDLSRDDFVVKLGASRLLTPDELEQLLVQHPNADALGLANALLSKGTLNDYQFDAIAQGKADELRIGNYDILGRLGAGGMGTVFKARHRRMKRIVALKVLSAALCKDEAFVQRFQREVVTIARLGHPNIVMAYDADEAEIGHFLVMEFVDGKDLVAFVENNNPLAVSQAVDCIIQAARGMAFAHAQGVVHRDIKPANLLRDSHGVVKVTDLGLARLTDDFESSGVPRLTQSGGVMGTVEYMAPEQAVDSTTVDHRADIYSLGGTLYFLLTGQAPFTGKTMMSILLKHRDSPIPSVRGSRPDVPPELDDVIKKMMAKAPDDRYDSMSEVVAALEWVLTKLDANPAGPRPVAPPVVLAPPESSVVVGASDTQSLRTPLAKPGVSLSVVVVEPSRVQAAIVRKYLEAQEIVVPAAVGTAAAALTATREHTPDAVVSALHLSDMTGVDLAKRIRAEFQNKPPGFVLISSETDDPGTLSQFDRVIVLHKPFTAEQLVQTLNIVTGKAIAVKAAMSAVGIVTPRSMVAPRATPGRAELSTLHVLIVDDSAVARTHERLVLQGLGFARITEAGDGAQAIAAATREPFDLIVTDYNMPLMDGYALVSYLKQTPATAKIPIVMVTTETSPAVLDPVRKLGVVAVLDKGFNPTTVKEVIDKLFR